MTLRIYPIPLPYTPITSQSMAKKFLCRYRKQRDSSTSETTALKQVQVYVDSAGGQTLVWLDHPEATPSTPELAKPSLVTAQKPLTGRSSRGGQLEETDLKDQLDQIRGD
ncbi:hypothetical protein PTTG_26812 [Puccinia triticina 1-1 BBBD Race 1]|uniref:Uncharacterized protein n=1 Tax=Puccinia triticina (isolate 1-1 / race 1 (BBBD)) TaxID=630390 RepID=A0A180GQ20_PUCT1|nr:hypothetical protein PTTG_26812 [Puccinia triticina 1-1 BBBD Race 1]